MTTTNVEYRPIIGFEGYRIGNDGSVWSRRLRGNQRRMGQWRKLRPGNDGKYLYVMLVSDRGPKRYPKVHSLVLEAFVCPRPEGMECCHGDGNPTNNVISNLRWDRHGP